jgi:hypothetical protein
MIIQDNIPPMLWSANTVPGHADHELPERALNELQKQDQWVNDFIERLNGAVEDLGRKR